MTDQLESRLRVLDLQIEQRGSHLDDERLAEIAEGADPTSTDAGHLAGCDTCTEVLISLAEGLEAFKAGPLEVPSNRGLRTISTAAVIIAFVGAAAAMGGVAWWITNDRPATPITQPTDTHKVAPPTEVAPPIKGEVPQISMPAPITPPVESITAPVFDGPTSIDVQQPARAKRKKKQRTPRVIHPALVHRDRSKHTVSKPVNGPARGFGWLRLGSKPPAQIFVDGKPRGWTPLVDLRLQEGPHDIRLIYKSPLARQAEERFRVVIEPDRTWATVRRNLRTPGPTD